MLFIISPSETIQNVQEKFIQYFKNMNIEFFSKSHKKGKSSNMKFMCFDKQMEFKSLGLKSDFEIEINDLSIVWELEHKFEQEANLFIQLFRKENGQWVMTESSDEWTIYKANTSV